MDLEESNLTEMQFIHSLILEENMPAINLKMPCEFCDTVPCPFCPDKPDEVPDPILSFLGTIAIDKNETRSLGYAVVCPYCGAQGPKMCYQEDALEAWNKSSVSLTVK